MLYARCGGLVLACEPLAQGARLLRLYGDTPCPALPETVQGLPLTELGGGCFAEKPPAALAAAEAGGAQHAVCGRFLEELTLPDNLRVIGNSAFYNCRALRRLSVGRQIDAVGSDVFANTMALTEIVLRARPDAPSGLYRLLGSISADVRVLFRPQAQVLAAARWPEYWEDIEESPAHILLHTFSGQGYHYRQCFRAGVPLWAEYDAIFPLARAEDPPAVITALALDRLRWPFALAPAAAAQYRAYLQAHADICLQGLLAQDDRAGLCALLAEAAPDDGALARGAAAAAAAQNTAFAAQLTEARQARLAAAAPQSRYSFDDL